MNKSFEQAAAALGQPFTEPAIAPVAGTGDVALTIGSQLIEIEGMTTGVIIDSVRPCALARRFGK